MIPAASTDPLLGLNPHNRNDIYSQIHERMPVFRSSLYGAWILSRHPDVKSILVHPDALVLEFLPFLRALCQRGGLKFPNLLNFCSSLSLFTRPPRHDAVRRVLAQSLGAIRRLDLASLVTHRAQLLLDAGERQGSIDLAEDYGKPLALCAIGAFLKIPEEDLPRLSALGDDMIAVFEFTVQSLSALARLESTAEALTHYFGRLVAARRKMPGSDGISLMVSLADDQMRPSDEDLARYCSFFFIAAQVTTAASISAAALMLLQRPALCAQLLQDPTLFTMAAQELLRLASPVQYIARQMRCDIVIEGQFIPAGEYIMLMLGAANRDPLMFPNPHEPDLSRSGPKPLMFATGPYGCIGAQVALIELEAALKTLLARRGLRLSASPPVWINRKNVAWLQHLPASFSKDS